MDTDYWELFVKSGSVQDYLKYKNSVRNLAVQEEEHEQSYNHSEWYRLERDANQRE